MYLNQTKIRNTCLAIVVASALCCAQSADGQSRIRFGVDDPNDGETRGFTEPFRRIELSCDEVGAISELLVEEGDQVQHDQIVARLDDRIQRLQVKLARHMAKSKGQLEAATGNLKKRQEMYDLVLSLRESGSTSNAELSRAQLELAIARAKHVEALEEVVSRQLDLQRAEIQLDRRWVRAPFAGVISQVHRQEGEFLSPVHPDIMTVVKIDKLIAVFNVPSSKVRLLDKDKEFHVEFADNYIAVGTLHSIGVETDAESGTTELRILLDNSDERLRSGEQCTLVQ